MARYLNAPLEVGLLLLLVLATFAAFPRLFTDRDPMYGKTVYFGEPHGIAIAPFRPGQFGHPWGSDELGRDLKARIVHGARFTLAIALSVTLLRIILAYPIGVWTGWRGGWTARVVSLLSAGTATVPVLVLLGLSLRVLQNVSPRMGPLPWIGLFIGVTALMGWPRLADHIRRRTEELKREPYVEGAHAVGASAPRIVRYYVWRALAPEMLVTAAAEVGWVLLLLGQLGILGVYMGGGILMDESGRSVETFPEWSQMLAAARSHLYSRPWLLYPVGIAFTTAVATFHILAEGLRLRFQRLG